MGRQAWISILGLYEYDHTIFDDMYLPKDMDRSTAVNNILLECAELEVLLPEPDLMKRAIGFWSRAQASVWDKLWESTQFEYNPIWNKDGTITEDRDNTETRNLKRASDYTDTHNLKLERDYDETNDRSAYNASTYQHVDKKVVNDDTSDTGTLRSAGSADDTGTIRDAGRTTRRETGNIGITTTQQMIKEEREIDQFSMYDYIVRAFKERFCILVY